MNNMVKQCVAILIGLALTATGLWAAGAEEEPAAAADKKYVTDPTNGKVVTAPEYGGTLTFVYQYEPPNADMSIAGYGASKAVSGVIEKLGHANWAIDRSVNDLLQMNFCSKNTMPGPWRKAGNSLIPAPSSSTSARAFAGTTNPL